MTREDYLTEKVDVLTEGMLRLTQLLTIDASCRQLEALNEFSHQYVEIITDLNKEYENELHNVCHSK